MADTYNLDPDPRLVLAHVEELLPRAVAQAIVDDIAPDLAEQYLDQVQANPEEFGLGFVEDEPDDDETRPAEPEQGPWISLGYISVTPKETEQEDPHDFGARVAAQLNAQTRCADCPRDELTPTPADELDDFLQAHDDHKADEPEETAKPFGEALGELIGSLLLVALTKDEDTRP